MDVEELKNEILNAMDEVGKEAVADFIANLFIACTYKEVTQ